MIKHKIQAKVAKVFDKKLADAVHAFTCEKVVYSGAYNPITETYENREIQRYTGRGVLFGSYQKDLVKPLSYQVDDSKAILLQKEVTAKPQINDVWVTTQGKFKVINIGVDPVGVTYAIQLRKVTG